jgi:hypothetical protein
MDRSWDRFCGFLAGCAAIGLFASGYVIVSHHCG